MFSMASLIFSGCIKEKKVHCADHISEILYYVSFVGFRPEILDTILIHRFSNTTAWDTTYLVTDTSLKVINDTSSSTLYLQPGSRYKISFTQSPLTFELKDPQYPKGREFVAIGNCNSARSSVSPPTEITVNGVQQKLDVVSINKAVVYLK